MKKRKASFNSISDKLEPIFLVLNPDDSKTLSDLTKQLEQNSKSLDSIEAGLLDIHTCPPPKPASERGGSIFRSFYGGKKQDKVQDKRNAERNKKFQDSAVFQDDDDDDSGDENSPYARIDNLRRKILQSRTSNSSSGGGSSGLSPPISHEAGSGRPISISGQPFSIPGQPFSIPGQLPGERLSYPGVEGRGLYERVEEVLPSPFLEPDMVRAEE